MQRFPGDACLITCMLHRLVGFCGDGFPDTQAVGVVGVAFARAAAGDGSDPVVLVVGRCYGSSAL